MDAILRVWEATVIAVHNGIVWMLNGLDLMTLGYERAKLGVVNAVQNMKVKTLLILEDMINSAIAKINNFISLLNYLPGVNISAVGQVTFGTMAKLSNKVQEELRNQKMAATEKDINNKINAREVALRALKTDTRLAQQARQAEIKALQSKATGAAVGQGVHDTIAGMAGNVEDIAGSAGAQLEIGRASCRERV